MPSSKRAKRGKDRGRPVLYVGSADDHANDVHRFMTLDTQRVVYSRDVTWLNQVYGDWKGLTDPRVNIPDDEVVTMDQDEEETTSTPEQEQRDDIDPKLARELKKLDGWDTKEKTLSDRVKEMTQAPEGMATRSSTKEASGGDDAAMLTILQHVAIDRMCESFPEILMLSSEVLDSTKKDPDWKNWYKNIPESAYKDHFDVPNSFDEAWNHPDPWQRDKWRAAILKEFDKMNALKVWKKIKKSSMPKGRRTVKHKWVLEIKRSGIFRARLVACGYSQVPGVDFKEIYSPVSNDVTFLLMLICAIRYEWDYLLMDVETAFLLGKLEEEIYMECPEGLEKEEDEILLLQQTIYGLVQSAREFFRLMVRLLKKEGFQQSAADPCLLIRRDGKGTVMISLYVDDCFVIGDKEALEEFKRIINKLPITVTYTDGLKDYLSCEIVFSDDRKKAWLGQPHLIKKLEATFGEDVSKLQRYKTPGTPGGRLLKPSERDSTLDESRQSRYRSGVGLLLYLVKWSRPDIANATRELAKLMTKATEAAEKELLRVIKYVLDTRTMGLRIQPVFNERSEHRWNLVAYSDSTWADDPDDRVSISGILLFVNEVLVKSISRKQKAVSLSSSEAEFYACAEAAKEIKFVVQLMLTMGLPVVLPIVVRVDNIGAIFLAENATSAARTRHIDTRYKFIREMTEDKFLKIVFVRSENNTSDGHTKNLGEELYKKHSSTYVWDKRSVETIATAIVNSTVNNNSSTRDG